MRCAPALLLVLKVWTPPFIYIPPFNSISVKKTKNDSEKWRDMEAVGLEGMGIVLISSCTSICSILSTLTSLSPLSLLCLTYLTRNNVFEVGRLPIFLYCTLGFWINCTVSLLIILHYALSPHLLPFLFDYCNSIRYMDISDNYRFLESSMILVFKI